VAQPLNRVEAQQQMEAVTDKWGIRIDRIEILAIAPPPKILEALALEKRAVQEKRAKIRQSEGQQQAAINVADGEAQAAVRAVQAQRQAAILRAEGSRQAAILEAEGRSQAISTVYAAIKKGDPDSTLVAILQLDALAKFADSDNAKIVVPFEIAGLLGAAQTLRSVLAAVPGDGDQLQAALRSSGRRRASPLWEGAGLLAAQVADRKARGPTILWGCLMVGHDARLPELVPQLSLEASTGARARARASWNWSRTSPERDGAIIRRAPIRCWQAWRAWSTTTPRMPVAVS
jgi:hypothetical protein